MKKTKKLLSMLLAIACVISMFSLTGISASAAKNPWDYSVTPSRALYYKSPVMTGSDVKWLQQALNITVNAGLSVDGSFGPATQKAVKTFQTRQKISVDGSFGPDSRGRMVTEINKLGYKPPVSNFIWPLADGKGSLVSKAGAKRSYEIHAGTDISASSGTKVLAIASGTVKDANYNSARGYYVTILHGNYLCVYQHLKQAASVKKGQTVSQGQVIGYVGSTGHSTGPHLHFEMALYSTLSKTGSVTSYLYNDVQNKKKPTYYWVSRGNKSGSYYTLNFNKA